MPLTNRRPRTVDTGFDHRVGHLWRLSIMLKSTHIYYF
jgi:hypothetical protein